MGNCQAVDTATLVIQHPSGKVDKFYWSVPASEIMKLNPGYYVALLITTTICHTSSNSNKNNNTYKTNKNASHKSSNIKGVETKTTSGSGTGTDTGTDMSTGRNSVRITRVKLLRPTDMLALGHVYRLISTKEVMKGLVAKKQAKLKKDGIELADSEALKEAEKLAKKSQIDKTHLVSRQGQGHRSRRTTPANGGAAKPRTWQPSLHSISESTS